MKSSFKLARTVVTTASIFCDSVCIASLQYVFQHLQNLDTVEGINKIVFEIPEAARRDVEKSLDVDRSICLDFDGS